MKINSILFSFRTFILALLMTGITTSASWATSYYVSKSGNDSNNGSSTATPFLTIQKGLNTVHPGDTVNVMAGTYSEALILPLGGNASSRITLQNYSGQAVTVNSGSSRTITIKAAGIGYWTISGLTLTAAYHGNYTGAFDDCSVDFGEQFWPGWGMPTTGSSPGDATPYVTDDSRGSNHNIVQNCTINGSIFFAGHYNTVQNCIMNGVNAFTNGIEEWGIQSHHNTYTGNTMSNYTDRCIHSMSNCSYTMITNNNLSHWGARANPAAIDVDGARFPCYYIVIQNNTIHDGDGNNSMGMQFENAMNCIADGNIIYNCVWGMTGINYLATTAGGNFGYGNYNFQSPNNSSNLVADVVRGGLNTTPYVANNIFSNNVVYNTTYGGANSMMTWGDSFYNNTFYNTGSNGGIYLTNMGTSVGCTGVKIINNIIANGKTSISLQGSIASQSNNLFYNNTSNPLLGSGYQTGNPLFNNASNGDFSLASGSPAIGAGATVAAVTTDIKGKTRPSGAYDIGAYQLGTRPTVPLSPPTNLIVQ